MPEFTGKDRVRAAYKRTFADRVPYYPILGAFNAVQLGVPIDKFLKDPETFAKCQAWGYEEFKPDVVVMMADLLMEAEAFGSTLRFPSDNICMVDRFILAEKENLKKLKMPDPKKSARLPYYLEAIERAKPRIADSAIGAVIVGPWAIAVNMRGAQQLILDTVDDPDFVHRVMRLTTDLAISFGETVAEQRVGLSYSEAASSCSIISPQLYRTFIKPYHAEIIAHFKEKKVGVANHVCGYIDPIMEDLVEIGSAGISFDAMSSLEKMMEVAEGKSVVIGNVDTILFVNGTREQMRAAVKKCVDTAADRGGFILASGCEIPLNATRERLEYFNEAAEELGKYE